MITNQSRHGLEPRNKALFSNINSMEDAPSGFSYSKLISASRSTGQLNLSSRQLQEVPDQLFRQEDAGDSIKWWEVNELTKLDLSHNEVKHLPHQMWTLTALNTLLISHNKLQQLLPGIQALEMLKLLDVSDNPLTALPEEVADLPSLASLNCSNCKLHQLPEELGARQPQLSAVVAAGNQLSKLPSGFVAAGSLVILNLSKNQLSELPEDMLAKWSALKELDVSHNQLQELPVTLGMLPCLTLLDMRSNALTSLPDELGTASSLVELKAGFNCIAALPASFGMLVNLKTLDIRNNLLRELPDTLCGLQLVLLDLTNNSLSRLPPALGSMTSLRSMPLDGNKLKLMRRELWSGPTSALLQHLRDQVRDPGVGSSTSGSNTGSFKASTSAISATAAAVAAAAAAAAVDRPSCKSAGCSGGLGELALRGKGLTSVPAEMWQSAAALSKLDLSQNDLSATGAMDPAHLANLNQLKVLCLNNCNLSSWPLHGVPACALVNLHTLEYRMNPLHAPLAKGSFGCCPALRNLNLSGVKGVQFVGDVFVETPQLEVLRAANAGIAEFPAAVLACTGLRQLSLSSNNIASLPVQVTQLSRLTELDLSNNQLSSIPPQVGLMSGSLRVLQLEGNVLRSIRRPILEKGTAALLDWLKDRIPA